MVVTHGSGLCCATCRLKNNFRSTQNRPPDILINVVVEGDGFAPLVGEIQIHLRSVLILKEMEHFHYEACAALHGVGVRYLWLRAPFSCAASAYCFRLTAPLDALLAHLRAQVRRAPTALALLAEAGTANEPMLLASKAEDTVSTRTEPTAAMTATREDAGDEASADRDPEAGWETYTDESTGGILYYYNKRLRRTTWTAPGECGRTRRGPHNFLPIIHDGYTHCVRTGGEGGQPELQMVAASAATDEVELTELFPSSVKAGSESYDNPMHGSVVPINHMAAL